MASAEASGVIEDHRVISFASTLLSLRRIKTWRPKKSALDRGLIFNI
jgi:hypothetical protein